jgi:hypothetical protein
LLTGQLDEKDTVGVELSQQSVSFSDAGKSAKTVAVNVQVVHRLLLDFLEGNGLKTVIGREQNQAPMVLAVLADIVEDRYFLEGTLGDTIDVLHEVDLEQMAGREQKQPGVGQRQ